VIECVPEREGRDLVLLLRGDFDGGGFDRVLDLGLSLTPGPGERLVVDLGGVTRLTSTGIAALAILFRRFEHRRITCHLRDPGEDALRVLRAHHFGEAVISPATSQIPRRPSFLERVSRIEQALEDSVFHYLDTLKRTVFYTFFAPFGRESYRFSEVVRGIVAMGFDALPLLAFMSFLIGFSLALATLPELRPFGQEIRVADVVGRSMTQSIGPLMTAVLVTGRSGGAMAAEIGTMKVSEELDALRMMGVSPVGYLVAPRCRAMLAVLPCLTIVSAVVGIFGGQVVMGTVRGIPAETYIDRIHHAVRDSDLIAGLVKSFLFAFVVIGAAAHFGFSTKGGAAGVGRSTTRSVVAGIMGVVVVEALVTAAIYWINGGR
jgi:phospholipid/cholesterol/gamma-HCH transport system permease protein